MATGSRFWIAAAAVLAAAWLLVLPNALSAQESTSTPEPISGLVEGVVTHLTPGTSLPIGIEVTLYALDDFDPVDTLTSTVESNGQFLFSGVPLVVGRTYIATLEHQGVSYGSSFVEYDGVMDTVELTIETYEATTDQSAIQVGRMHVIIDLVGDDLRVSELYIFDNTSDRVFIGSDGAVEDGTIVMPLPLNAADPLVERSMGDSMVPTSSSVFLLDGEFRDTIPVRPGVGAQQLMVTYQVPFQDLTTIEHRLPYGVASLSVLLPDVGLSIQGEQLEFSGSQTMQSMSFLHWSGSNLEPGETLSFEVTGEVDMTLLEAGQTDVTAAKSAFPMSVQAGDTSAAWGIGLGGLLAALGLAAFLWVGPRRPENGASKITLLNALAELDEQWEEGAIRRGQYEVERERIKSELADYYG